MLSKILNKPLKSFLYLPKLYISSLPPEKNDNNILNETAYQNSKTLQNIYDLQRFDRINDPKFIAKILKEEEQEIRNKNYRFSWSNFKLPLLFLFLTGFFFHCWFTVPYKVVYKHVTISDKYSIDFSYCYSWILAPLSIRNTQDFLFYFPLMAHALFNLNRFFAPRHFFVFYLVNGLISGIIAFCYEKYILKNETFKAKCLGGCSTIGFMGIFLAMKPEHKILKQRLLPYEILVLGVILYELTKRRNEKELSKPAHLIAFINGLIFGRACKHLVF